MAGAAIAGAAVILGEAAGEMDARRVLPVALCTAICHDEQGIECLSPSMPGAACCVLDTTLYESEKGA